jgi:hypothetical protein
MSQEQKTPPADQETIDEALVLAVREVRQATTRQTMGSDGGSSGKSDSNDSTAD